MTKKLLRLLRIAPLALLFAGIASAQTTGTIIGVVTDASTGKPVAGAVVIATSPLLQGEQTAVTDDNGNYRLVQLPPGEYKLGVQLEGYKPFERSDITVRVDRTIRTPLSVVPEAVQMEEQVVRTGAAPVVNIGSAESGTVVSREFLNAVPLSRSYEGAASVAPTAKVDALGGIAFAGAQSPENQYLIDGLNTTDPVYGNRQGSATSAGGVPALRTSFVQELDVKTGNFGAEYGRATGGILNVVLKGGSNEYHGSVFGNLTPNFLVSPDGETINIAGDVLSYRTKPDEGSFDLDLGFEVGGPIMKDKLWFYAGFAPVIQRTYYERSVQKNVIPTDVDGDPATAAECPAGSSDDGYGRCANDATGDYLKQDGIAKRDVVNSFRNTYQWVGKLTYLLDENNTFTLAGFGGPSERQAVAGSFFTGHALYAAPSRQYLTRDDGNTSVLARYGGKFLDKRLITDVQIGWYSNYETPTPTTTAGVDQRNAPVVEWLSQAGQTYSLGDFESGLTCLTPGECAVDGYTSGGYGGYFERATDRYAAKASAAYLFDAYGQHNIKGGVDLERVQYEVTQFSSGGAYYLYQPSVGTSGAFVAFRGYGNIEDPQLGPGNVPGLEVTDFLADPARIQRFVGQNKSETDSFAYFLQDSWSPAPLPNLTVNYGVRLETQSMKNLDYDNSDGFEINDNWSPRLQAVYDITGTGRSKVAGSWGRFYYAMPLNMGNRSFGNEVDLRYNLSAGACGFALGSNPGAFNTQELNVPGVGFPQLPGASGPTSCTVLTRGGVNNDFRLTGGLVPVDPDLKGQYVDMFGAQAEYEVFGDLSVGLEWNARRQGWVIEDMSGNDGGSYFIGNPGKDQDIVAPDYTCAEPPCIVNSKDVTTFDVATGREVQISFPKPERSFDGLTFKMMKNFSQNWLAQASYTYSVLRGNYSGPYYPEYGQLDPGITGEYDLASLMGNKEGLLPGDQTHQIKLYGAYVWNLGPRFNVTASGAYEGVSGTPVSALGSHPDYGSGSSFIVPRGQGGRTPWVNNVDLGAGLGYVVKAPYAVAFRVDLFNVFNSKTATAVDENYTFDTVQPITGLNCDGNYADASNPAQALQDDCPAVAFLKTVEGRPAEVNPNFGKANLFKAPLSMRLSLSLTF